MGEVHWQIQHKRHSSSWNKFPVDLELFGDVMQVNTLSYISVKVIQEKIRTMYQVSLYVL